MTRWLLLLALLLSLAGMGAATSAAPPAAPAEGSAAALIAASRAAFDVRRYVRADSLAEAACVLLAGEPAGDPLPRATALVALARARAARRSLADSVAVRSARQALALLPSGDRERDAVRADAHDVLALILDEQNRSDLALDHAHRALALRRACFGDAHEEVSESWYRLGTAQMSLGRADSALATMRAGLAVREGLGLARDRRVGDFHCEIATLLEASGDLDGARDELDAALREYAARLGTQHAAMTQGLQRLCIFEYHNGDLARAADLAQQAVALAESLPGYNPVNLALLRANLAISLTELGDAVRARRVLEQVVPVYTGQLGERHRQTLWAETALATTESALGDTAAAAARYRGVCRRFESGGPLTSTGALTQARAGLAQILADREPRAALALAAAAEAAERARPDLNWTTVADVQALQLRLHADLGDRAAVARLDTALARTLDEHRLRGTATEAEALTERSLALARTGRTDEAVAAATAGAALARVLLVRELRALPDREGLTLAGQRSAPLEALLGQALDGKADAQVAWDELVRWRGLVADEVARRRPPLDAGADPAVVAAHEAWLDASRRLARAEVRAAGSDDETEAARLAELRARATDAERRWATAAPRGGAAAVDAEPEIVRRALGPGTVLVSFASVRHRARPERLAAFVVGTRGAVRLRDLGPAAPVEKALVQWRAAAGRPPQGSADAGSAAREAGLRLRALTWDVVSPLFAGAREVVIIADGPLHQLPWAALPDGRDGYLVESGPAVRVLEAERDLLRGSVPAGQPGLLAVGGVDFGAAPADTVRAAARPVVAAVTRALLPDCRDGRAPVFAPLPGTGREVEAIAREHAADVQLLRGAAAGEAAFKRLAPGRRVIHLATHALALDDLCEASPDGAARGVGGLAPLAPEASPPPDAGNLPASPWLGRRVVLALAGANAAADAADENEGLLTADEVATLDLRGTEWVVLSACESGVAASWNREGVLGLTRAFRLAGARAVIASQWAVDDDATCEWMTALHRARARGATGAGEAMRQASREVLRARRAAGRSTHPYYWAAFTATGD